MRSLILAAHAALFAAAAAASPAHAEERVVCVYDPMGTTGPAFRTAQQMQLAAKADQGVDIVLKAHVEEKTAASDLTARQCDAAVVTGVEARNFGLKTATVEAIGALPDYTLLRQAIGALAHSATAKLAVSGDFENAGIFPGGAVLLFVRNKAWRRSADLAGKRLSFIGGDKAALTMISTVGASGVSASTANFANLFNNGTVDACYAPATAYDPLELGRGVGTAGGIIDFPLSQLTLQVVIRHDRFPEGFGQWGRTWASTKFGEALDAVKKAEVKVASKMLDIPEADKPGYDKLFREVRVKLKSEGIYDATVLAIMKKLRCKADATRAECALSDE
jgi:hypothetical protein